ncbi:MAG: bifunctional methylenetetrahydrofolate dehydrogenase/methenyltetrahydrofolate cyclohydrolase FolD [Candidatus Kapabacteria bacterium]|jgi:methylenetetrahydrofolate dehydrogenase (NADP+)/methenyltetrahydrofolate cyclohydrolase|nr:bifunctional methylenetetrahydrofolate dehydrogenase/methenyltetrahydrofolate cyclohydrolase FolD [Candidatus Kapabacteria bacterium]
MTQILDGKAIAQDVRNEIAEKTRELKAGRGIQPGLAVLLIGDNAASHVYVRSKAKACEELGFYSIVLEKPATVSEKEVLEQIQAWNADPRIHGILVQLPLPAHIDEQCVLLTVHPAKDVDGFHPENVGRLVAGLPCYAPCTPAGVMEILKRSHIETKGKHAVVVGRSNIVGKPMANLLYQKAPNANAIVTICHTAAPDIAYYTRQADILVAAVGVPEAIHGDNLKDGVVVIDVGINRIDDPAAPKGTRLVGDVHFESASEKASAITPVPGGVGPMTIAMLMLNTYRSAAGEVY